MRLLLTGADGYIGVLLAARLAAADHEVTGLDLGLFNAARLYPTAEPGFLRADTRSVEAAHFEGQEAVIHLAELSNDPLGQLNPTLTRDINIEGSLRVARLAREAGVRRFVYFSSCSVYGEGGEAPCDENSPTFPQTEYAHAKLACEAGMRQLAGEGFEPVFLRNATVYGPSPRMRFDLVVNNLSAMAHTAGRIDLTSDGTPWRPLIHIQDLCDAALLALQAPAEAVSGKTFNCGGDEDNYRIRDIADAVNEVWPDCRISLGQLGADRRSYRVNFARIRQELGFVPRIRLLEGVRDLRAVYERVGLDRAAFAAPPYTRLREIEALRATGALDEHLRWTT